MEYQLDNGCLRLLVASCGAQIQAIEKDGAQYLWDGDEEYWPERAPLLFPFVGRFTEGKYRPETSISGNGADKGKDCFGTEGQPGDVCILSLSFCIAGILYAAEK